MSVVESFNQQMSCLLGCPLMVQGFIRGDPAAACLRVCEVRFQVPPPRYTLQVSPKNSVSLAGRHLAAEAPLQIRAKSFPTYRVQWLWMPIPGFTPSGHGWDTDITVPRLASPSHGPRLISPVAEHSPHRR